MFSLLFKWTGSTPTTTTHTHTLKCVCFFKVPSAVVCPITHSYTRALLCTELLFQLSSQVNILFLPVHKQTHRDTDTHTVVLFKQFAFIFGHSYKPNVPLNAGASHHRVCRTKGPFQRQIPLRFTSAVCTQGTNSSEFNVPFTQNHCACKRVRVCVRAHVCETPVWGAHSGAHHHRFMFVRSNKAQCDFVDYLNNSSLLKN